MRGDLRNKRHETETRGRDARKKKQDTDRDARNKKQEFFLVSLFSFACLVFLKSLVSRKRLKKQETRDLRNTVFLKSLVSRKRLEKQQTRNKRLI